MKSEEFDILNEQKANAINAPTKDSSIIFFTSNNYKFQNYNSKENKNEGAADKVCIVCGLSFYSKFNRDRHFDEVHLKLNLEKCPYCNAKYQNIKVHMEKCKYRKEKINLLNNNNIFIGSKHFRDNKTEEVLTDNSKIGDEKKNTIEIKHILSNEKKELENLEIIDKKEDFIINDYENNSENNQIKTKQSFKNGVLMEKKTNTICINPKALSEQKITDIIKTNFYYLLKKNKYLLLNKYFLFKELILGNGKYGTVWFGVNVDNAKPVAIKYQNNNKSKKSFLSEIMVMKKLKKYKIFTKLENKLLLQDKIFLIETLLGPNLDRLHKFCQNKFSIPTIYKIGVELIQCLKFIHQSGYLYIDINIRNISLLLNPIKINKIINHITLIDFGFCNKYIGRNNLHLNKSQAPRLSGNFYFSSINALYGNAVSRKDDIISICYLLIYLYKGRLPWEDIKVNKKGKEEIIKLKKIYTPNILCENDFSEVLNIYNDAINLDFSDKPNYNKYIELLCNYFTNEKKKI